jgi:hypothetical protein
MSIRVQSNAKPPLTVCKMNCDDGLHPKLNEYELTKFLNAHQTSLLIGKPKSGKTSLLYSLFKSSKLLKKTYHNIYLFQPSASRASMKDKLFDKLPEDHLYEELALEDLQGVLALIKADHKDNHHCIIFDDMTAYLKNKTTLQTLKEMIFNRRHLHLSIFFLVQTWFSVPKEIRKLFNNIFVFKVSKNEMENIFEEVVEQKKELVPKISKLVFDKPYQYLLLNTESQRLFKGFDELIVDDGDADA